MKSKIALSKSHLSTNEITFISDAIEKNEVSIYGDNLFGFENDLENYLGYNKKIACLSSGTAAIHLALVQLEVSSNDEVICQSFTFCGSANPILYQGAKPVFIGSESDTWNMCPTYLEIAIKDRIAKGITPKAIIIVHLYGMPAKMEELQNVALKYNIPIIEDAAEALGSRYKGRLCGTFGAFSVFSFNGNKIITTAGGGALVCNTEEDKAQTIFFSTQARENFPHYQHSKIGYNYRMDNISAGIGRGQMEVLDQHILMRREVNKFYINLFKNVVGVTAQNQPGKAFFSNFWLSCIIIEDNAPFTISEFENAMENENIETRPLWKPMHLQPIFKDALYFGDGLSQTLFKKGVCMPSGSNLSKDDLFRISKVVKTLL